MSNTRRVRTTPEANLYRPPAARLSQEPPQEHEAKPSTRQRRPDLQVYVPRSCRLANDTSPQSTTCPSPPTQPPPPSSQKPQEPKSTRHRNCSPNIVTPRKKSSQRTSEKTTFTTISSESNIFELDNNDNNSKTLPYFIKKDILLPSENNTTILEDKISENIVETNDTYTTFVKSNETYSSTNDSTKTKENNDKITEYLETTKIEFHFPKFLQNGHNNLTENFDIESNTKFKEIDEKFTEYLKGNRKSKEMEDKITEHVQSNTKSKEVDNTITNFFRNSLPENTSLNDGKIENIMLIQPKKYIISKKIITPAVLKISTETNLFEPLIDLEKLVQNDSSKKVKRTKSACSKISVTSKSSTSSEESPMSKKSNLNIEECSWDMLFADNGDCLEPSIMDELTKQVGRVEVERPSNDHGAYENAREAIVAGTDYPHVLEVYAFPVEFKTQDLLAALTPLAGRAGFELKWVDNTHALAVFSNSQIAAEVLSYNHPMLKTRPLSQACPESKQKVRKSSDFLQPYRARPQTCTAVAKRLISSALGVRITTSKEEREKERSLLREAREKKRLAARQSEEAWEGKITSKQLEQL